MMRVLLAAALALIALPVLISARAQTLQTEATHAVILDHETGQVLFSKNGTEPMIPASMTKMMTAHVVFDRIRRSELSLEDTFTVSERAWREGGWASGGSTMGLAIGDQPTVKELLMGVIVLSGNDACIVLAEGLSGSEEAFAEEMTRVARDMGLESATFRNSTGLYAPDHRISAIDLARLASEQIRAFPDLYSYYAIPEYEWRGISQPNRNPLLGRVDGVDGLKTGHLEVSGYGLTASAVRDGVRRIVVVNGLEDMQARARESERLMRMAFSSFGMVEVTPDATELPPLPVWLGERPEVPVRLAETGRIAGLKRALEAGSAELVYEAPLEAPIAEGARVATLELRVDGADPVDIPVVAAASVARLGFQGRVLEGLRRLIEGA